MTDEILASDRKAILGFLRVHGLCAADDTPRLVALNGGVSSLVVRADAPGACVVVKQALPRLRVQQDWRARVERSAIEARCAQTLADLIPGAVPEILAVDEQHHRFAMRCAPEGSDTWKTHLMAGRVDLDTAARAGTLLGLIHARSAARPALSHEFDDRSFFEDLRVDPYLRAVARRHPAMGPLVETVIGGMETTRLCLVHGDYSPKNMLVGPTGQLLLIDHEVAHWGDPAFDIAFALSHLCLKAIKFPQRAQAYLRAASHFSSAYAVEDAPGGPDTWQRSVSLLGALLLARVDGKSPAEYLVTQDEKQRARHAGSEVLTLSGRHDHMPEGAARLSIAFDIVLAAATSPKAVVSS